MLEDRSIIILNEALQNKNSKLNLTNGAIQTLGLLADFM